MSLLAQPLQDARPPQSAAAALLEVRGLGVRFGEFVALRGVSLELRATGVHALIGPNGAGKTTLFNAVSGFARPSGGSVRLGGMDITGAAPDRLARLGLARSFQICSVFPQLSVSDNLRVALTRGSGAWRLLRRHGADEALAPHAEALLQGTGLDADRRTQAASLSYGRRRLLEIITTLALRPRLLLLDEPMAGLAREDIAPVTALIARAAESCGVLLVEHNLKVVESLAAEVTVMAEGAVLCRGSYAEVARDPRVMRAYIGAEPDA